MAELAWLDPTLLVPELHLFPGDPVPLLATLVAQDNVLQVAGPLLPELHLLPGDTVPLLAAFVAQDPVLQVAGLLLLSDTTHVCFPLLTAPACWTPSWS